MASKGQFVTLGPFTGGLNRYSDEAAIQDNELAECENFELDIDGALKCRPPISGQFPNVGFGERIYIIGSAILNNTPYVFGASINGVYAYTGGNWTLIRAGLFSVKCLQFRDKVFFLAHGISPVEGGTWDGTTFVTIAGMPRGEGLAIYKNRLWIAPGDSNTQKSRLRFSDVLDPTIWDAADFFDVSPGDGERLMDLVVFNNNLLLFKQDSTHALSYDTRPSDAVITKISNSIGVSGNNCIAVSENDIFIYHEGELYQFINYEMVNVSLKVPFEYDTTVPVGATRVEFVKLSVVGSRILVRYYNRLYVYNKHTQSWSRWTSQGNSLNNVSHFVQYPNNALQGVNAEYIGGSTLVTDGRFFRIYDGWDGDKVEKESATWLYIKCKITTKTYAFDTSYKYKRLFWWGCDAATGRDVVGTATPVVIGGTSVPVTTTITNSASSNFRRFFKFPKALRFRQISFTVTLESYGYTVDGPAKLYEIIPVIGTKQTANKSVS
jgi:hypothetical protein